MYKYCRLCRFCYCVDESDVSGFDCEKFKLLKITDLDKVHQLCLNGFRLSLLKLLFKI